MLNMMIEKRCTSYYIVNADIESFFNHLGYEWIMKFIGPRTKDPNILRLIRRMLKAGIMEGYLFSVTEERASQGLFCSPIITNIYMHFVLVW